MGGAVGFLWLAVVLLALAWALNFTGTVKIGVDLGLWLTVLLVLTVLGVVFAMFVQPFIGRRRTTRTYTAESGTTTGQAPAGAPPATGAPASGMSQREVVQETQDRPSL
jgi:hypothetical protein